MHALALAALLGGCAATDPLERADLWHPSGANEQNLAAEVADPADLVRGRESGSDVDGQIAANAIVRLRTDHVKKLPDSSITDLQVGNSGANNSAAGP